MTLNYSCTVSMALLRPRRRISQW